LTKLLHIANGSCTNRTKTLNLKTKGKTKSKDSETQDQKSRFKTMPFKKRTWGRPLVSRTTRLGYRYKLL